MKVAAAEQELLAPEIATFAAALHDPAARARYAALGEAVAAGEVGEELVDGLAAVLEVGLLNGRFRRLFGPEGEQTLSRVYGRTPTGAARAAEAAAVTKALAALRGQVIEEITISAGGPGGYSLTIDTDRCEINVRLDRGGVRVNSVEIGV
jgi:hypothetical protein